MRLSIRSRIHPDGPPSGQITNTVSPMEASKNAKSDARDSIGYLEFPASEIHSVANGNVPVKSFFEIIFMMDILWITNARKLV